MTDPGLVTRLREQLRWLEAHEVMLQQTYRLETAAMVRTVIQVVAEATVALDAAQQRDRLSPRRR